MCSYLMLAHYVFVHCARIYAKINMFTYTRAAKLNWAKLEVPVTRNAIYPLVKIKIFENCRNINVCVRC